MPSAERTKRRWIAGRRCHKQRELREGGIAGRRCHKQRELREGGLQEEDVISREN